MIPEIRKLLCTPPANSGGGCTKASIACGNLTPYLCYGAYPEVTVRKRFSKCTKQKFPCVRSPSGDMVPSAVAQSEASLQTKISCCMSTKAISCGEPWRNHPKRNVVPILQTRSCMLLQLQLFLENKFYSKLGGKIKFNGAIVKKLAGKKKYVGGSSKYCNLKCFQIKLTSGLSDAIPV